jgi:hypothetical protein
MKKRLVLSLVCVLSLFLHVSLAEAVGVGLYSSFGKGSADWEDPGSFSNYRTFETDSDHRAFGLVMDTRLAGDRLFNYHLTLGYDTFTMQDFLLVPYDLSGTPTTPLQQDLKMKGFVWSHAFGFGAQLSPHTRLWLGPELRFQWAEGKPAPGVDVDLFGVGFGPTVGFNMNFRNRFSLVLKTGYQMITYDADIKGNTGTTTSVSRDYDLDEKLFYVNLEFLVRSIGDR